jgi:hypothetical protein
MPNRQRFSKSKSDHFRLPLLKLVVGPTHAKGSLAFCDKLGACVTAIRVAVNDFG